MRNERRKYFIATECLQIFRGKAPVPSHVRIGGSMTQINFQLAHEGESRHKNNRASLVFKVNVPLVMLSDLTAHNIYVLLRFYIT